jgi:hypothetical protein
MIRPKPTVPAKRVWRISASAPMGEWVKNVARGIAKPGKDLSAVSYDTWAMSSYDLLGGIDVSEDPSTIPGDLFDELFAPKPDTAKSPGE